MTKQAKPQTNKKPKNINTILHVIELTLITIMIVISGLFYVAFVDYTEAVDSEQHIHWKHIDKLRRCIQTNDHECRGF